MLSPLYAANTSKNNRVLCYEVFDLAEKLSSDSYSQLDLIRRDAPEESLVKTRLSDPVEFKRVQKNFRELYTDKLERTLTRKELLSLIKIYKNPALAKLKIINSEFWNTKVLRESLEATLKNSNLQK